jgi:excisionase family DNA binding protein
MSEPAKQDLFALLLDQIRIVIAEEIAKALDKRRPAKLQFTTAEAAAMLGVKTSWLAAKARTGEVSYHRQGHKVFFTQQDVDEIMARSAINGKNGKVE